MHDTRLVAAATSMRTFGLTMLAAAAVASVVTRWERTHGVQVVVGHDDSGDAELYAVPLPRVSGHQLRS